MLFLKKIREIKITTEIKYLKELELKEQYNVDNPNLDFWAASR
jgi:hypothetical protein